MRVTKAVKEYLEEQVRKTATEQTKEEIAILRFNAQQESDAFRSELEAVIAEANTKLVEICARYEYSAPCYYNDHKDAVYAEARNLNTSVLPNWRKLDERRREIDKACDKAVRDIQVDLEIGGGTKETLTSAIAGLVF